MQINARDGKLYEVSTAPVGGTHEVTYHGTLVGTFVLKSRETVVHVKSQLVTESTLVDIADRFVDKGGAPMGIL